MLGSDPTIFFLILIVILLSLSIHEFAHAKLADAAGDPTPRIYGRVTLNPLSHLDPVGTIMIILSSLSGFGIGWGKPVPVNPSRMRNPRWDHFVSVAAGPLSNLILAAVSAIVLRLLVNSGSLGQGAIFGEGGAPIAIFLMLMVLINLSLCFFNLIPLGPLDGHWLVGAFLPEPTRVKWYMWNRTAGGLLLLMVVFGGQLVPEIDILGRILQPVVRSVFYFLTRIPL
jgi:Zn-dependent protease